MAEPIKKSDLIQGDPIDAIRQDLEKAAKSLDDFDTTLTEVARTLNSQVSPAIDKTVKGIRQINDAEVASEKLLKQKLDNEQKQIKVQIEKERLQQAELRTKTALNREAEKQAKASARAAKAAKDENSAYKKLVRTTRDQKNAAKDLAAEMQVLARSGKRNTKEYAKLGAQYRKTAKAALVGDKALKKIDRRLGDNFRNVGNYRSALSGLGRTLGTLGVGFGIGQAARGTIETLTEFDEKIADVQKTTGLSAEAARSLSQELLKIDTRSSITSLQELASAAGRLGVEGKANILEFAEAADKVFVALGDDLEGTAEEIATNLGKVSSLFGLEDEFGVGGGIERVGSSFNELSANSKASAGAIQNFTNRMAGLSEVLELEDVTALGALFDETGQSAEVAASTLIKLIPDLSKNVEGFAEVAGMTAEEFKSIAENSPIEALKAVAKGAQNNEKGVFNLTKVLESYGVTSARASGIVSTLTNNVDRLTELQGLSAKAMEENTSITNEFNTKNDTLAAQYDKTVNKLKAYILGSEGATKVSEALKNALKFLADNLETIIGVIVRAVRFYGELKVAMFALKLHEHSKGMKAAAEATGDLGKQAKGSARSLGGLGKALKGLGLAVAIDLALELALAFYDVASGAAAAREQRQLLDAALAASASKVEGEAKKALDSVAETMRVRDLAAREAIADAKEQGATAKELADLEQKLAQETADIKIEAEKKARKELNRQRENSRRGLARTLELQNLAERGQLTAGQSTAQVERAQAARAKLRKEMKRLGLEVVDYDRSVRLLNARELRQTKQVVGLDKAMKDFDKTIEESAVSQREISVEIANNTDKLSKYSGKTREAAESTRELVAAMKDFEAVTARIDAAFESELADEFAQENDRIEKHLAERMTFLANAERKALEIVEASVIDGTMTADDAEIARTSIAREYQALRLMEEEEALEKKIKIAETYGKDTTNLELELAEKRLEIQRGAGGTTVEAAEETANELLEIWQNVQEAITNVLEDQIDKRIDALDREIDAAKRQQDLLQELAANGNINAQQSITEAIEVQRAAQAEQIRLEQLKQRIELASAGLKTFTSALDDGQSPSEALATTITTTQVLTGILANLPFFARGTDAAPEGWAVVDEQGAEIIADKSGKIKDMGTGSGPRFKYLEQGDKVYTAQQSSSLLEAFGDVSNSSAVNKGQDHAGNTFDLMMLEELKNVSSKLDSVGVRMNVDWQGLASGIGELSVEKYKGGDRSVDRYRVK